MALVLSLLSVFRAHKQSFSIPQEKLLRQKDVQLLNMNKRLEKENKRVDMIYLDDYEVAYARFPVMVKKKALPFALALRVPEK